MIFRRTVAALTAVLGVLALCMAVVWGTSDQMIEASIANSARIDALFRSAAAWVDDFQRREKRLPSSSEFQAWTAQGLAIVPPGAAGDLNRPFAAAPPGAYVLSYWRGEWFEYYASWIRASTLVLDKRAYHLTGSGLSDGALAAAIGAALLLVAARVWRKP